jgi:hypothetical protein
MDMKTFKKSSTVIYMLMHIALLMGCDRKVTIESVVHPDGVIDRTIVLTEVDSIEVSRNMFGLNEGNGWKVVAEPYVEAPNDKVSKNEKQKYTIAFRQSFSSVEESNKVLSNSNDTLFSVTGTFEKKFRWFYTYLNFTDTYRAINRFGLAKPEDYFTQEDFSFINRMPAEGKSITKADSVYLDQLNKKIFDQFAMQSIYNEHFNLMLDVMRTARIDQKYIESYMKQKGFMFSILTKKENDNVFSDDAFMHQVMDSLHVDFPYDKIVDNYKDRSKEIKSRLEFMSEAGFSSKYTHIIKMPWDVIATNADSINGTTLIFQPLALKFLLRDYTLHASSRKLNYWVLIVSGLVVAITIGAFVKGRSRL